MNFDLNTWGTGLSDSLRNTWHGVAIYTPNVVFAIIIFVIGWIVGSVVGSVIAQIIRSIKIDQLLKSAGVEEVVKRTGYNLNVGVFLGTLVKWFVIVVFLIGSFNALGLNDVTLFLQEVLMYLPRVIVAVLILLVAVVIADVMQKIVSATTRAAEVHSAHFLGIATKWAIWIFALLAALEELRIAVGLISTIVTGVVVAFALAFGLAFGLGGQEAAARTIERVRNEISHKG